MAVAANAVSIVDDFSDGPVSVETSTLIPLDYDSSLASVVGGTRYLGQSYTGPAKRSAAAIADGSLNVSTPSGAVSVTALCYGNVGSPALFSTEPDWFLSGTNDLSLNGGTLRFSFLSNEQPLALKVVMQHDYGYQIFSTNIAGSQYSPFDVDLNMGSSLQAFDTMYVQFTSSASGDFELSNIQAVPEPASMAVLGLGALGIIRRRRNKA